MGKSGRPGKIWEICMETEGSETENNGKTGWNPVSMETPAPRLRSADEPMKLVLRTLATAMASKGCWHCPSDDLFQVEVWISHITIFTIEKSLLSQWNRHSEWYLGLNTVVQTLYHRNCIISGDPPFWDKAMNRTCWGWYKKTDHDSWTSPHTPNCILYHTVPWKQENNLHLLEQKKSNTFASWDDVEKVHAVVARSYTALHCTTLHYTTLH